MSNSPGGRPPQSDRLTPLMIAVIYFGIGGLWIVLSDQVLAALVSDVAALSWLQTAKGWFYVAATAGLLYWLIRRSTARLQNTVTTLTREMVARQQIEAARLQAEESEHQQRLLAEALRDTAEALTGTLGL